MTAANYSEAGLQKVVVGGGRPTAGLFFPAGGGLWGGCGEVGEGALQSFVLLFFGRKQ